MEIRPSTAGDSKYAAGAGLRSAASIIFWAINYDLDPKNDHDLSMTYLDLDLDLFDYFLGYHFFGIMTYLDLDPG